jgi:hypothetical protein
MSSFSLSSQSRLYLLAAHHTPFYYFPMARPGSWIFYLTLGEQSLEFRMFERSSEGR